MRLHHQRGQSGPYSIHDARQHAGSLLTFGPGAPGQKLRPHPGLLPDVIAELPPRPRASGVMSMLRTLFRTVPDSPKPRISLRPAHAAVALCDDTPSSGGSTDHIIDRKAA